MTNKPKKRLNTEDQKTNTKYPRQKEKVFSSQKEVETAVRKGEAMATGVRKVTYALSTSSPSSKQVKSSQQEKQE